MVNQYHRIPSANPRGKYTPRTREGQFISVRQRRSQESVSNEFLRAEFSYMSEAIWKNEERGDRRVNFFVTVTAAVIAATVALATGKVSIMSVENVPVFFLGLVALLLFGICTLQQMIRRKIVTDDHIQVLDKIRAYFLSKDEGIEDYLAFSPERELVREMDRRRSERLFILQNGGNVEMVGLMNGVISAVMFGLSSIWILKLSSLNASLTLLVAGIVTAASLTGLILACFVQVIWVKGSYDKPPKFENNNNPEAKGRILEELKKR